MTTERQQLERARELILNKQFDAARAILSDMPGSETAAQWLAKLDEIAPVSSPPLPTFPTLEQLTGRPAAPADYRPSSVTVNFTLNPPLIRSLVAVLTGLMGVFMIVGFFSFAWMDFSDTSVFGFDLSLMAGQDDSQLKITPLELWTGRNDGENFTLDMRNPEGGFSHVRALDRLLILIPAGGLVLVWLAWAYFTRSPGLRRPVLMIMAAVALALFIFPFAWESFSNRNLKSSYDDSLRYSDDFDEFDLGFSDLAGAMIVDIASDAYSTGEQKLLGFVAFAACLVGLFVEALSQRDLPRPYEEHSSPH